VWPTLGSTRAKAQNRTVWHRLFMPYCMPAVHRCSLLLQILHVVWSVCLCVLSTHLSWAKTAKLIEMLFGRLTALDPRNCVLVGVQIQPRQVTLLAGDLCCRIVTYLCMSALILPQPMCLSSACSGRVHLPPWGVTTFDVASCQVTLNTHYLINTDDIRML